MFARLKSLLKGRRKQRDASPDADDLQQAESLRESEIARAAHEQTLGNARNEMHYPTGGSYHH